MEKLRISVTTKNEKLQNNQHTPSNNYQELILVLPITVLAFSDFKTKRSLLD